MDFKKKRILQVEDDAVTSLLQKRILERNNYDVVCATTGEDALAVIDSGESYDLILMDIELGSGIDGTETAKIILKNHDTPIIFVSSHTEQEVVKKIEGITSYGYILKNSGEFVLIASIKMAFRLFEAKLEAKQKKEQLVQSELRYRNLFLEMQLGVAIHRIILDNTGKPVNYVFLDVNPGFEKMTGLNKQDIIGKTVLDVLPETEPYWIENYGEVALTGKPLNFENFSSALGKYYSVVAYRTEPMKFAVIIDDVTIRKRTEKEKEILKNQLSQSQKMESIGRLAGGIAHDFNNMLSVILFQSEAGIIHSSDGRRTTSRFEEIKKAALRSAELTKQLLLFARKQSVTPKVLYLNDAIAKMMSLLRKLIGEDIKLNWLPDPDLWTIKIDPTQIDQILVNLLVNARDAIKDTGSITLETKNIVIDEDYCRKNSGFIPGKHVMLAVSDNGCGMDQETISKIFEPLFTTKDVGKGTGFGLSTVYGIVKQNKAGIKVYSELGHGTTFKIYFPCSRHKVREEIEIIGERAPVRGSETIVLVEDEKLMIDITTAMLREYGYTVIPFNRAPEALKAIQSKKIKIDLLITDVIMPEMNGRVLAEKVNEFNPLIKVLFVSGYTANVISRHGVLEKNVPFLQKPFSINALAQKVREVLDSKS